MKQIKRRGEAGFTLLEVMAAFVIAAFGSIALYEAGFEGTASAAAAARVQEAVVRAQSRLASIGILTPLQAEQLSGDDGGGYHWQINITPVQGNSTLSLYQVQVIESFGDRQVTLVTDRLSPGQ
jgi:general secretion pathway protein I